MKLLGVFIIWKNVFQYDNYNITIVHLHGIEFSKLEPFPIGELIKFIYLKQLKLEYCANFSFLKNMIRKESFKKLYKISLFSNKRFS